MSNSDLDNLTKYDPHTNTYVDLTDEEKQELAQLKQFVPDGTLYKWRDSIGANELREKPRTSNISRWRKAMKRLSDK